MASSDVFNLQNNPLLNPPTLPHGVPPFDKIRTEHFMPAIKAAIQTAKADIEAIKNNKAAPTFANTIEALELTWQDIKRIDHIFGCFSGTIKTKEIEAIEEPFNAETVRHKDDVRMDAALFARVKTVYDARTSLSLTGEQSMLLERTYQKFVRSGALLNAAEKKELREINEKISALKTAYENNSTASTGRYRKVIDNEADLAGIPERVKATYKEWAKKAKLPHKWVIKLSPPPTDLLQYCTNRALREEIWRADSNIACKGKYDNHPVVLELVKLRRRRAKLLGYADHAAYILADRMAKTPETVMQMLERNLAAYKPGAEDFLQKVKDFAKETDGLTDLKPWDFALYSRLLEEKTFKMDLEELRPYFEMERVLKGLQEHTEKLFNITMTETTGKYPVYHPDVKSYEIKDKKTDRIIGIIYMDYYARAGEKRSGAWMDALRSRGIEKDGQDKIPIVYNSCNFDKPTPDQPALLSVRDVETIFHEFGHALHALLAEGTYPTINGVNVKWDFVEAPSQIQENWTHEKEVLDSFAVHYKTGKTIPADFIEKMKKSATFTAAWNGLRQTFLGLLDMAWYLTDPATIKSVEELEDKVRARSVLLPRLGGPMSVDFGHIFSGGYDAGYNSYKNAEALEADLFSKFQRNGLYHQETAAEYRALLAAGGTKEPMDLFVAMMGRKPDPDALFRREGLLPANDAQKASAPAKRAPKPNH